MYIPTKSPKEVVDSSHSPLHLGVDCDWLASILSCDTGSQQKLPVSSPANVLFHCNKSRENKESDTYSWNANKVVRKLGGEQLLGNLETLHLDSAKSFLSIKWCKHFTLHYMPDK